MMRRLKAPVPAPPAPAQTPAPAGASGGRRLTAVGVDAAGEAEDGAAPGGAQRLSCGARGRHARTAVARRRVAATCRPPRSAQPLGVLSEGQTGGSAGGVAGAVGGAGFVERRVAPPRPSLLVVPARPVQRRALRRRTQLVPRAAPHTHTHPTSHTRQTVPTAVPPSGGVQARRQDMVWGRGGAEERERPAGVGAGGERLARVHSIVNLPPPPRHPSCSPCACDDDPDDDDGDDDDDDDGDGDDGDGDDDDDDDDGDGDGD
eukprot:1186972-Rhodomonas_salina.1